MISLQMINGLKHFFKEEQLSDRRLCIIEIEEDFSNSSSKRKFVEEEIDLDSQSPSYKRLKGEKSQDECCSSTTSIEKISQASFSFDTSSTLNDISNDSGDVEDPSSVSTSAYASISEIQSENSSKVDSTDNISTPTISSILPIASIDKEGIPDSSCRNVYGKVESVYSEFPIHSIVLCINSNFFKKLLVDSGMKETSLNTVSVKVNYGEGKYLELLIEAFYNEDILKELKLSELLSILDIAARFSCTVFIQQGLELLNCKQIKSVVECDSILQHISRVFEVFDLEKRYKVLRTSCIKFLSKKLYPLELNVCQQDLFWSLHYITITYLISSNQAFVLSENHVFLFLYQWLSHNKECQTPEIIKNLIDNIKYESLTVNFICDELTICDQVLNIWKGYPGWFTKVLKYHALTPTTRCLRDIKNTPIAVRCIPAVNRTLEVARKFSFENGYFDDTIKNQIIWAGSCVIPTLTCKEMLGAVYIRMKLLSQNLFSPTETISNFYRKFEIYYCLLPGDVSFNLKMLQHKKFLLRYVRKSDIIFKNKPVCNLHVIASTDEQFVNKMKLHGVNLMLFFKTSPYSWIQFDMNCVKPNRKIIHLKGDKSYSVYTE